MIEQGQTTNMAIVLVPTVYLFDYDGLILDI